MKQTNEVQCSCCNKRALFANIIDIWCYSMGKYYCLKCQKKLNKGHHESTETIAGTTT
jgi:hypothetical protein